MTVTYRGRIVAGVVVAALAALLILVIVSQAHGVSGHLAQSSMAVVN